MAAGASLSSSGSLSKGWLAQLSQPTRVRPSLLTLDDERAPVAPETMPALANDTLSDLVFGLWRWTLVKSWFIF